ncbi:MAG TPA: RIP metalloprotease RseP [Gemmatimonadales bacterium]|nr:RIP metalloprotease RseP [Gemmatimonadales bacterium]
MLLTLGAFLLVLGVLVFVHELGHFVAAKAAGIMVHRFSLGIGSPIPWLTTTRGETEYSVSWLPLGGYVKMATAEADGTTSALEGAEPEEVAPPERRFESKPVWVRMIVILAGVTMNVLFAWAAFTGLAFRNGSQIDPTTTVGRVVADSLPPGAEQLARLKPGSRIVSVDEKVVDSWEDIIDGIVGSAGPRVVLTLADSSQITLTIGSTAIDARWQAALALQPWRSPVIGQVLPSTPADRAGMQPGDTVISIDGTALEHWFQLLDKVQPSSGKALSFVLGRAGGRVTVSVTPLAERTRDSNGVTREVGKIGIGPTIVSRSEPYSFAGAIAAGGRATLNASTQIVRSVRGMLSGQIDRHQVGGPIMIAQLAGQQARLGLSEFVAFMALVSVNLAVLNLLPIPVLDGGQFMFLLAELLLRRPLSLRIRERLTILGLVLVGSLMLFAFWNDLARNWGRIVDYLGRLAGG